MTWRFPGSLRVGAGLSILSGFAIREKRLHRRVRELELEVLAQSGRYQDQRLERFVGLLRAASLSRGWDECAVEGLRRQLRGQEGELVVWNRSVKAHAQSKECRGQLRE
jgi:hypothetical protein